MISTARLYPGITAKESTGMVKTELSMQILKWSVKKPKKAKMIFVDKPVAKSFKAVSFSQKEEFDRYVRVRPGRAVCNKPTAEDESLHKDLGGAESAVLEETNMFQTDSRDLAADREAEEQEHYARAHGSTWTVTADPGSAVLGEREVGQMPHRKGHVWV